MRQHQNDLHTDHSASTHRRSIWICIFSTIFFASLAISTLSAQGIRGIVIDDDGLPLSFATIFIHETGSGTTSNMNGKYEIPLEPGTYHIDFRHLGHKSETVAVTIQDRWIDRDIVLTEQAYTLSTAEIHAGSEDPAYPIMRKAIAKSGFFRNQVDGYTCRVYLKGSGQLTDYPWFAKSMIKKEGIDTTAAFTTESITEVTYTRPNKYEEKVIRIRTTGDDQDLDPLNYINGSFYDDKIAGLVSPLSKKAFAYYKFRYLGTYHDGDYQIEKIRVTPRLKDEGLFTGELHIVDGLWNIHNLSLSTVTQGIKLNVVQNYAPIVADVWLPVSHRYFGSGSLMGFDFEFNYLASVSDYHVEVNQALQAEFTLLDEKSAGERTDNVPLDMAQIERGSDAQAKAVQFDTLTTRQLRKLMNEYAREERKQRDEPQLIGERNTKVDSTAATSDPEFWVRIRPVPLTPAEVKGYELIDSLAIAEGEVIDTSMTKSPFSVLDIFLGGQYRWKYGNRLRIDNPVASLRFNTVDGFNGRYRVTYEKQFKSRNTLEISPVFRYAHSRDKGTGFVTTTYSRGDVLQRLTITGEGGTSFRQFNRNDPISTFTNSIATLLVQKNFMKIYDRTYGELRATRRLGSRFQFGVAGEYNHREQTYNTTNQAWFNVEDRSYSSNEPKNNEMQDTGFGKNDAFLVEGKLSFFPTDRYGKTNGTVRLYKSGTEFNLTYRKGIPNVGKATADFDFLSLEAKHTFELGIWGQLRARMEGGKFLTSDYTPFMDYAHFMGNGTIFTRFKYMTSYLILPYYDYSTNDEYLSSYFNLRLNRFLLSQFSALRSTGLSEYINFNHLITPSVQNYVEVGYSVGNIFRLFRIDVSAAFLDGKYSDFRIQLGITSELFQFDF